MSNSENGVIENPENIFIYECSTNLVLDGDATYWVSKGYEEGWVHKTYDRSNKYKLPYPIDKAYYTDAELNVSRLQEGLSPCVIGRVIALNRHPIWSVVVFVSYAKDNKGGRGVPVYRLFFCEGNNLRTILDRVHTYEKVNGRLPFFDPFMNNGFLNDYQDSNIDLAGLIQKEDSLQVTSELDKRLMVLPNGTFDVNGGLNALSLLKLNLLTKQRAIAQAKNTDPNMKVDKITKISWAYNADVVLEKAETYGVIQAYDDAAYKVLIKKSVVKVLKPKPPEPTSIDKEEKNGDISDKPWDFLSMLKSEAVKLDLPEGFDAKPIADSFSNLIKSSQITPALVGTSKDMLFDKQKELESIVDEEQSLYTFVKIAIQNGLSSYAFQKAQDIQAIRLYILICILFPVNIEQQKEDIYRFRNKGFQSYIDSFIQNLTACSTSSPDSSQKIIETGFKDIFSDQGKNIEQVAENVKWLWTASPWSHPGLLEDVDLFLRKQILLVEENKPQEVSTHFQFLNGLYENNLREKTILLRSAISRYPNANQDYQFEWKLWEIDKIKSRKREYNEFYKAITQNCTTRGSARCRSLAMLLYILSRTYPSLEGAYNFFASISDNGQPKLLEYQPDRKKDISEWVIDRTKLLALAQKNKAESSNNYTYARIYNVLSWIVKAIPHLIKEIFITFWEFLQIIVNGLQNLIVDRDQQPVAGGVSQFKGVNSTRRSDSKGDRLALTLFKIWLASMMIAGGIVLWGFAKDRAIDKVVEKLPEIDKSFTKILNSESEKFFRRYQPKPDRCDIILANSELTYSGCNTNFTEKGDESTKIKIASTLVDQGFVSWRIDLFGDGKFKIDYNITADTVTNPFKQKYQETPYPSLIDKLEKDDYFINNSLEPSPELSKAYFDDLNAGKYKHYGLVSYDKIAKHIYTVLDVEDKKYRNKRELVNAIYRYQVKDINLFIDGKIPKGAVFQKNPITQINEVKTPADDTYESIKLKLRRNLNQDLKEKFASEEDLKKEFEALKKKAEDRFNVNANPKEVDAPTKDTTKSALNTMVDTLKSECKDLSKIDEAIVAELTSASPNKNENSIDLRKAINNDISVYPTYTSRLIEAIFDYQIGSVKVIKVNRQGLPTNEQGGEDKEVLSGWDGIINLNGGVFNKVRENVSKQLGCQKKNDIGGGMLETLEKFGIPQIP